MKLLPRKVSRIFEETHHYKPGFKPSNKNFIKGIRKIKNCPCEGCISYAICVSQQKLYCKDIWEYLMKGNVFCMCNVLSLYKSRFLYVYISQQVELFRDKGAERELIFNKRFTYKPKVYRYIEYCRYWSNRGISAGFSIWRSIKNGYRTVVRGVIKRDI